ncbi:hypothetical protein [Agrococcus sp. Ld7]|uniref:hypothetical protein n=1 Tax=Agrococcus sp. Ld7 TaxID=649148 RepID=UPI0038673F77
MNDDELRRRLHEIPAPSARLDAEAVLAGAKRRRRPKTIALSSAATVAAVLLFAPLVAPGISSLGPSGADSTDAGAAQEAAPQSSPSSSADDADGDGTDSGAATEAGPAGEEALPLCGLPSAGEIGLVVSFAERPTGATPVQVRVVGDEDARVTAVAVDSLAIIDGGATVEAGASREQLVLDAGESAPLTVVTVTLEPGACGVGEPAAATPVAIVGVDGMEPIAVVGSPWE